VKLAITHVAVALQGYSFGLYRQKVDWKLYDLCGAVV
jgi:hypothetical protein